MNTEKHQCHGRVLDRTGYHSWGCSRNATLQHDGRWYCKTHYPPAVEKRRADREKKWDDEHSRTRKIQKLHDDIEDVTKQIVGLARGTPGFNGLIEQLDYLEKQVRDVQGEPK
jgi:hypothetical protein